MKTKLSYTYEQLFPIFISAHCKAYCKFFKNKFISVSLQITCMLELKMSAYNSN